jgi:hypothetical protein
MSSPHSSQRESRLEMNTRRFTWSRLPPPRCRGSSGESERDIVFTRQFRIIKPRTTRPCAARWKRNLWNLRNRGIRVDGARNVAKLHAYLLHHLEDPCAHHTCRSAARFVK